MNLTKLFESQKVLRDRIGYNEPDRFNKLILALLVEIGECANEWRGFKFWSVDQEPRTKVTTYSYQKGKEFHGPTIVIKNLLLEEYVDGLHFVLELGLEDDSICVYDFNYKPYKVLDGEHTKENIELQFINLFFSIKNMFQYRELEQIIEMYLGLGEMLGFTWEQIEEGYFRKNKINHTRQDNGY